jgi:VWFA-related protein
MMTCTTRRQAHRWVRTAGLIVALGVMVGVPLRSQESSRPDRPTGDPATVFRSGVTLVSTDVIVRDGSGVFVPDLTENDFRVFEDERPQDVASLVLVHGGRVFNQLVPPPQAQEGIILPPTRAVNDTAGRIFVILVDDLHIETSKTPRARAIFEQLMDNLIHEGDMFGIVSTGPSSIRVDMTYDRSLIKSSADRLTGDGFNPTEMIRFLAPGPRGPSELSWRAHVAFKTMRDVVQNLERVQNRRKVVIYFSSGYDFNPFAHERIFGRSPIYENMRNSGQTANYAGIGDPMMDPFERISRQGEVFNDADLAMEIAELTKAANRANASFYTVDPRGLVAGPDADYNGPTEAFQDFVFTTQNSLRSLAELTGGRAVVNRNDFDDAFREIDAETSDYYVVGFYSSNSDPTFRTRRLRVEVNRDGLDVQHRTHYTYARSSENAGPPLP